MPEGYPLLPYNHGSVENHPKNERKLMLEIHPFSTKKHDYGRQGGPIEFQMKNPKMDHW